MRDVVRWSRRLVMAGSSLLMFFSLIPCAVAQDSANSRDLADAPQPPQVTTPTGQDHLQQTSTGTVSGTVLDTHGDVLQGAGVTLTDPSGSVVRTMQSGDNGQFAFTALSPDVYKLTVSAPGMSTFTSEIALHAGESRIAPAIKLSVSPVTTSVTVGGNKKVLAVCPEERARLRPPNLDCQANADPFAGQSWCKAFVAQAHNDSEQLHTR